MRDRRFLQHAMTKIEDERLALQRGENFVHRVIQSLAACDQSDRIEISLHAHAWRQGFARPVYRCRRIDTDSIDTSLARITFVAGKCRSARKSDDLGLGMRLANLADNFLSRFDDPADKC